MNVFEEEKNEIIDSLISDKLHKLSIMFKYHANVDCYNNCKILYPNPDECQIAECSSKMCD